MTSTLKEWTAYKHDGHVKKPKVLGFIEAKNAPEALGKAWEKWPHEKDAGQVQFGFFVRPNYSVLA